MTNFNRLVEAKRKDKVVEIVNKYQETGVAGLTRDNGVMIYQGRGTGEDDIVITAEEFNSEYEITKIMD